MTTEERFTRIETSLGIVSESLAKVIDNQAKFDTVLSVLAEAMTNLAESTKQTQEATRNLERQWQAYINTIRPS